MKKIQDNADKLSLAQRVATQIENLIIKETFTAGSKLPNEFELADSLNVGRGTIREAIKILTSRNVLEVQRGRGTYVTTEPGITEDPLGLAYLNTDKLKLANDLLEVRMMIEPKIAALAAINATEEEVKQLINIAGEIEDLIINKQSHEIMDKEFHSLIAKSSQNSVVPNLLPIILKAVSIFIDITDNKLEYETIQTHRKIVKAIENHQPKEAERWMINHLNANKQLLDKLK